MNFGEALKLYLNTFAVTSIITVLVYLFLAILFDSSIANIVMLLIVIFTFIVLAFINYITKSKLVDMAFLRGFFEGLTEVTSVLVSLTTLGTFSSILSITMSILFVFIVNDAINRFKGYSID